MEECANFMQECCTQGDITVLMNPELSFNVSDANKHKIKELLVRLQKEKLKEQ